tara:strand:+ start:310 stop:522 length:213 start_codon:yes stop_codon:yes gene_type:complete
MKKFDIKSFSKIDYNSITLSENLLKILKTHIWVEMHDPEDHTMPRGYQADVYQELLDQISDCIELNRREE